MALGLAIYGHFDLCAEGFELFDGSRAIDVAGYEERLLVLLCLHLESQLAAHGCLTRALQSAHEHHGGASVHAELCSLSAHERGKLVVHNLHEQLPGLHGGEDVLSQSFLLHLVGEGLCHFVVHVGVDECAADVLHGLRYVDLRDASFAFQYLKRPF